MVCYQQPHCQLSSLPWCDRQVRRQWPPRFNFCLVTIRSMLGCGLSYSFGRLEWPIMNYDLRLFLRLSFWWTERRRDMRLDILTSRRLGQKTHPYKRYTLRGFHTWCLTHEIAKGLRYNYNIESLMIIDDDDCMILRDVWYHRRPDYNSVLCLKDLRKFVDNFFLRSTKPFVKKKNPQLETIPYPLPFMSRCSLTGKRGVWFAHVLQLIFVLHTGRNVIDIHIELDVWKGKSHLARLRWSFHMGGPHEMQVSH